jgi:N-acetylglucosamine kinase-like BadF-type ATPase
MPDTSFSSLGDTGLFLGIDGGGTRTRAVLLQGTGSVIGLGEADSSNFNNMGEDVAADNLRLATHAAFTDAGIPFSPVQAAFLGLAAVRSGADMARMTAAAESRGLAPVGGIQVKNDLHNALAGGLDGEAGLALISGTGSSCLGRDPKGGYFNCGGWAWFMDDGGSGFGLSHDALRTAVRMVDGRETPTSLLPAVLDFYEVPHPDCLLERLYNRKWTPAEIASFAPAIMKLAAEGDLAAMGVLRRGAVALAELVSTTAANLEFSQPPRVVLLGGCVRSGAPYQPMVESEIRNSCPGVRLCEPLHDTIYGAALNALLLASSKNLIPPAVRPRFPKK